MFNRLTNFLAQAAEVTTQVVRHREELREREREEEE